MSGKVSFVDLFSQHQEVRAEIETAFKDIIDKSSFIGGKYVSQFENDFANYLGIKNVIGTSNGTDAIWLALVAAGVRPGDAVITVPNTFIATVEAISRAGAYPLFVDVELATSLMDIDLLQSFLENECQREDSGSFIHQKTMRRIAAIVPVHLYGLPVDLDRLVPLARQYGIPIVEDACQAHGAKARLNGGWKKAGTFGVASAFSFYPGKNLGAMGDAGAVATDDPDMAEKMKVLRDHGSNEKYIHTTPDGWNSRLDSLQAAVLSAKLKQLDYWNNCRREAAKKYQEVLRKTPLVLPSEPGEREHVYHLYVIHTPNRDLLKKELSARGIDTGIHYPIPLHLQKAYDWLNLPNGSFPNTEYLASSCLSLPMHPALSLEQINSVGSACAEILK